MSSYTLRYFSFDFVGYMWGNPNGRLTIKRANSLTYSVYLPLCQLDRALPSEGKGQQFESARVHQLSLVLSIS